MKQHFILGALVYLTGLPNACPIISNDDCIGQAAIHTDKNACTLEVNVLTHYIASLLADEYSPEEIIAHLATVSTKNFEHHSLAQAQDDIMNVILNKARNNVSSVKEIIAIKALVGLIIIAVIAIILYLLHQKYHKTTQPPPPQIIQKPQEQTAAHSPEPIPQSLNPQPDPKNIQPESISLAPSQQGNYFFSNQQPATEPSPVPKVFNFMQCHNQALADRLADQLNKAPHNNRDELFAPPQSVAMAPDNRPRNEYFFITEIARQLECARKLGFSMNAIQSQATQSQ